MSMDLNEFDELIGLNNYRSDAGKAYYGLRNEIDALDAPCNCPCVDPGRHGPDPVPPVYEPSEECLLHGFGAPHTAFPGVGDASDDGYGWAHRNTDDRGH